MMMSVVTVFFALFASVSAVNPALFAAHSVHAFNPAAGTSFATFGNAQTKELLKMWQPAPLQVPNGDVLTPSSTENMKRFVRARILLEDPSLGCVASFDDALCIVLTRFSKAEHRVRARAHKPSRAVPHHRSRRAFPSQLVLPLWRPSASSTRVFEDLVGWHKERFGGVPDSPRLSGSHLETDKEVWAEAARKRGE